MKLKDLYLEAARRVAEDEDEYSCHAISYVMQGNRYGSSLPQVARYTRIFNNGNFFWFARKVETACRRKPRTKRCFRTMMLCLMAECWKDFR